MDDAPPSTVAHRGVNIQSSKKASRFRDEVFFANATKSPEQAWQTDIDSTLWAWRWN